MYSTTGYEPPTPFYYATKHEIGLSSATTSSNTVAAGAIIDSILLDAASL